MSIRKVYWNEANLHTLNHFPDPQCWLFRKAFSFAYTLFKYRNVLLFSQPSSCFHFIFLRKQNTYSQRLRFRLFCSACDHVSRVSREDLYFGASWMHSAGANWNGVSTSYTLFFCIARMLCDVRVLSGCIRGELWRLGVECSSLLIRAGRF